MTEYAEKRWGHGRLVQLYRRAVCGLRGHDWSAWSENARICLNGCGAVEIGAGWVYVGQPGGPPFAPGFGTSGDDPLRYRDLRPYGEEGVRVTGEARPEGVELGPEPEVVFVLPEGLRPFAPFVQPVVRVKPDDPERRQVFHHIFRPDGSVLIALVGDEPNPNWEPW